MKKETDSPEHEQIQRLDEIVQEVKQSEEWEAVNMSIAKAAMERGEIIRKLQKGKTPKEISEDLEEDLKLVSALCIFVQKHASEYDVKAIYEDWKHGAAG